MKRNTLPVICIERLLDKIKELETAGTIAADPLLADWNQNPLKPDQRCEILCVVHKLNPAAPLQCGEEITRFEID